MSLPNELLPVGLLATPAAGAAAGYEIERSLRFNSADSAYLSRTPASAGNRKTWTFSVWVKLGKESATGSFRPNLLSANGFQAEFWPNNTFRISGPSGDWFNSLQVFRDFSAWFHLVITCDTTLATADDRIKVYVNGSRISNNPSGSIFQSYVPPSQNYDTAINNSVYHTLGAYYNNTSTFEGYLADAHMVDAQALDPTSFGEFDANGVWQPIEYTGFGDNPNDGTTWSSTYAAAFAGNAMTDSALVGSFTGLNSSITITLASSVTVSSSLRLNLYANVSNFATYTTISINGVDQTANMTLVQSTGTNSGVWEVTGFTGTLSSITLGAQNTANNGISRVIVDEFTLLNSSEDNSFHLPFSDNSTAAALGDDTSGNGNDWTPNNFAVGGAVYSDSTTNTTNPKNAFDGSLSTSASNTGDPSNPMVFSSLGQTGVTTFEYYTTDGGTYDVAVNGGSFATDSGGTGWRSVSSPPSTFSSISIKNTAGAPNTAIVRAFRVNGTILVDSNDTDNDSLRDSPTNGDTANDTGAGGQIPGNYATLNPLDNGGGLTLTNGNLDAETTVSSHKGTRATFKLPSSGKWYFEGTIQTLSGGANAVGVSKTASSNPGLTATGTYFIDVDTTSIYKFKDGSNLGELTGIGSPAAGSVLQVAYDADAQKLWFGHNNSWASSGNPAGGTNETFSSVADVFPTVAEYGTSKININFGQRAFAYAAPSGFKALCTANLDDPTIADGSDYMDVALYTGNGGTKTISGLGFSPDLMWIKNRNSTYHHALYDTIRGATKMLSSSETAAEITYSSVTSQTTGFQISGAESRVNENNLTYAAWTWDAGSSTVSNTDGSINSEVRANASAGFSIATFTSPSSGTTFTVGHGLNVTPSFVIVKGTGAVSQWITYHKDVITATNKYLALESTAAIGTYSTIWGTTLPTSTVVGLTADGGASASAASVMYSFAPVEDYSAFGSYVGADSNPKFVYTGFRPKFILVKETASNSYPNNTGWYIWDSVRGAYNYNQLNLTANTSNQEGLQSGGGAIGDIGVDMLSNGFCLRGNGDVATNWSGGTYIYAAFAEYPFRSARAR